MTAYWVTIATVGYLLFMARLTDPMLDARSMGNLPAATSSRIFIGIAAFVLIGVAGLRWRVGTDFLQYVHNYEAYRDGFFADLQSFSEPGIKGVAWLVANIRDDAAFFIFAASVITIGLMLRATARYTIAIGMSYLLFIFVGSWHGSFNGIRQFLAAAVILAGHRYIVSRKPVRYLVVVAIATAFHVSALPLMLLYVVSNKKLPTRAIILMVGVAAMFLYASDMVLGMVGFIKGGSALDDYVIRPVNPLRIAVAIAPIAFYWSRGVRTMIDGEWFYRNLAIVHAAVMVAASWSSYLGRFGIYTTVFLPLVLPRLIDFPDRRLTFLVRAFVVMLFAAFWYVDVSGSSALSEFRFVFGSRKVVS